MSINLFWHRDSTGNFGDDLNPWLVERITGQIPTHIAYNSPNHKHMMIGSILGVANANTTVWGSGMMFKTGWYENGLIKQELIEQELIERRGVLDELINRRVTMTMDTQEQQIRDALIQLGWTPPENS